MTCTMSMTPKYLEASLAVAELVEDATDWDYLDNVRERLRTVGVRVTDRNGNWIFHSRSDNVEVVSTSDGYALAILFETDHELTQLRSAEDQLRMVGLAVSADTDSSPVTLSNAGPEDQRRVRYWCFDTDSDTIWNVKDEVPIAGELRLSIDNEQGDDSTNTSEVPRSIACAETVLADVGVSFAMSTSAHTEAGVEEVRDRVWHFDWRLAGATLIGVDGDVVLEIPVASTDEEQLVRGAETVLHDRGLEFETETRTATVCGPFTGRVRHWYLSQLPPNHFSLSGELTD